MPRPSVEGALVRWLARNRVARKGIRLACPEAFFAWFCRQQRRVGGIRQATYTLSFDCDYEHDMAALGQVLDALAERNLKASFAVVGRLVEKYPDLHRRIVSDGHEVLNHTYSHPERDASAEGRQFNELSSEEQLEEIVRCHQVCLSVLDYAPVGFRAPHFADTFRSDVYPLLREIGYRYSSSTVSVDTAFFGAPFRTSNVWEVPTSCSTADPFQGFDSWNARRMDPRRHGFDETFRRTIRAIVREGAYVTHYFDPSHVVAASVLGAVCEALASARPELRVLMYREVVGLQTGGGSP
jgi:peptidoglycan/xylan/chitin deacetylase (PgdA/CDA1 family)